MTIPADDAEDMHAEPVDAGYGAQIEGLQRELRDAKELIADLRARHDTAWTERDALSKQLTVADNLLRAAIQLLGHFAGIR